MAGTKIWRTFYLFLLLLVHSTHSAPGSKIKHIIVLMEENRSFDHFFGWYPGVNGLTGKEYNQVNTSDPNSDKIFVTKTQPWIAPCDPDHSTIATAVKVFGHEAVLKNDTTNPTMCGFVEWEGLIGHRSTNYCAVMEMLTPEHLPVATALAEEFVMFDRFFASHPGPTNPNRLFALTGTSAGLTETGPWYHNINGKFFPQKSFFDQLEEEGLTWRNYFNDTPWELFLEKLAHSPDNLMPMEQFFVDASEGTLPSYAWINPRSGMNLTLMQGSNDDHPDHDVALGEQFYKDIYEALRASPQWEETLFIITFDEHGGYYDHVPTPMGIPPPGDGETSYPDANVEFNQLGVRIPTLLISPWIPKGLVLSEPPAAQKPEPNSEYSLTSIMATARILLGMKSPPLTKRDAWSATFEQVFNLSAPRTDCPMHLPSAPPPSPGFDVKKELAMPVNGIQEQIMTVHAHLAGVHYPHHIQHQGKVSQWMQDHLRIHVDKTKEWKQSKLGGEFQLYLNDTRWSGFTEVNWKMCRNASFPFVTFQIGNNSCLSYNQTTSIVLVTSCYPSASVSFNRDPAQQWIWDTDGRVRAFAAPNLCLTNDMPRGDMAVYVRPCVANDVTQYWSWSGDYNPGDVMGQLNYGADIYVLGLAYPQN